MTVTPRRRSSGKARAIAAMLMASLAGTPVLAGQATHHPADPAENARLLRAAARMYGLDPNLLRAIEAVESGGDANAVSPAGAQGLMQLMPATAARFGIDDAFDPADNVLGAARFLSWLRTSSLGRYSGSPPTLIDVIAAYNAGEGAVSKYDGMPPYPETQQYVRRVLTKYLFSDARTPLGSGISVKEAISPGRVTLPDRHHRDVLDELAEIQKLRAIETQRLSAIGAVAPVVK